MLEHKHIIIRATVKKPPVQIDIIKQWVRIKTRIKAD